MPHIKQEDTLITLHTFRKKHLCLQKRKVSGGWITVPLMLTIKHSRLHLPASGCSDPFCSVLHISMVVLNCFVLREALMDILLHC